MYIRLQTRTRKFMRQNVTREWFCVVAYYTVCSAVLCQYNPVAFYCGMQMICMFITRFCAYGNNQYTINHIRIGVNICFPIRVQWVTTQKLQYPCYITTMTTPHTHCMGSSRCLFTQSISGITWSISGSHFMEVTYVPWWEPPHPWALCVFTKCHLVGNQNVTYQ